MIFFLQLKEKKDGNKYINEVLNRKASLAIVGRIDKKKILKTN